MKIGVLDRQSLATRRGQEIFIRRDKRQWCRAQLDKGALEAQRARQMDGIVAAQPMATGETNRLVHHELIHIKQQILACSIGLEIPATPGRVRR